MKIDNHRKNLLWNTIGTALFSFNSLFLMIIVTRINGPSNAGIFSFAFASACIINVVALYCGRTYQVTDHGEFSEDTYIITRFMTSLSAIFLAFIFVLLNQYSFGKSSVFMMLCILKCIEAISDVFYGILHKRHYLHLVGKSLTYKSLISLVLFLIVNVITNNLYLSCLSLLIVNIVFLLKYDMYHALKMYKVVYSFQKDKILRLLKKSLHTFLFTVIVLIIINIPRYAIDLQLTEVDQAIYGIISMPATFMMLLGQFILQPLLMRLHNYYKIKDKKSFNKVVLNMSVSIFVILLFVLPFAYFLGIPILQFIYKMDLSSYKFALLLILIGAAFYATSNIFLNALITLRCTKEQFILQTIVLVLSVFISMVLTKMSGLQGSILSYVIILMLQFIFYVILYRVIVNRKFTILEKGEKR